MNFISILESLLFVVGDEGLSFDEIKKILEIDDDTLNKTVEQLNLSYGNIDSFVLLVKLCIQKRRNRS